MPEQSKQQDLAYHIFSVLAFFFDSRDDGACRYRWEEELLKYFGAGVTEEGASADFHKFEFAAADAAKPDYEYYNRGSRCVFSWSTTFATPSRAYTTSCSKLERLLGIFRSIRE